MGSFLKIVLAAFFLFQSPAVFAAQATNDPAEPSALEPVRAPLQVNIDVKGLSASESTAVKAIATAIGNSLYSWATFPIELPHTIFQEGTQIIEVDDLYQTPTSDEVARLGRGPDGKARDLSVEDQESIRKQALIIIPSIDYPGMNHVWKVSGWLQKGSDNITLTLQQDVADGLKHLIVGIPSRLYKKNTPLNFASGMRNIYFGLKETLGLLVGLIEKEPVYSYQAIEQIVKQKQIETVYSRLSPTVENTSYLQIYRAEVMDKAAPILAEIDQDAAAFWGGAEGVAIKNSTRASHPQISPNELENILTRLRNDDFISRIKTAQSRFEAINVGLTQAIIDHSNVLKIIYHGERDIEDQTRAAEAAARRSLLTANPLRSKVIAWLDAQTEKAMDLATPRIADEGYQNIERKLRGEGLNIAADMLVQTREYMLNDGKRLRESLMAEMEPSAEFQYKHRIWLPSNYRVTQIDSKDADGNPIKVNIPEIYTTSKVTTDIPFWRIADFAHSTASSFKNGAYWFLVDNFINGPFGVRSIFGGRTPFYADKRFNAAKQTWENDPDSLTQTLLSRHNNLWTKVRLAEERFLAQPDNFISRRKIVGLYNIWNKGIRGGVGTALLWTLRPTATTINIGVTAVGSGLSIVWAPMTSAFMMGFNFLIYDTKSPNPSRGKLSRFFPFASSLIAKAGIYGVGQTLGSIVGSFYHSGMALGRIGLGYLRSFARTSYDALIRGVYIRPFGTVPVVDNINPNSIVHRIAGPGISSNYFLQVKPEIAVAGLRATLERNELRSYRDRTEAQIQKPVDEFTQFMKNVVGQFVKLEQDRTLEQYKALVNSTDAHSKKLREAVEARLKFYGDISGEGLDDKALIRQSVEDLNKTLAQGTAVVKDFYLTKILSKMSDAQIANFWNSLGLIPNSWQQLTELLLAQTFTKDFLIPLESTDESFRFVVEHEGLRSLIDAYESGLEDVAVYPVVAAKSAGQVIRPELMLRRSQLIPEYKVKNCGELIGLVAK